MSRWRTGNREGLYKAESRKQKAAKTLESKTLTMDTMQGGGLC